MPMTGARRWLWVWGPAVLQMALIFALSAVPNPPAPPGLLSDKVIHCGEYAVLAVLLVRALAGARWDGVTAGVATGAIALSTMYGAGDEAHQLAVAGRSAEVGDFVVDAAAAVVAAGGLWAWGIIRRWRRVPHEPTSSSSSVIQP